MLNGYQCLISQFTHHGGGLHTRRRIPKYYVRKIYDRLVEDIPEVLPYADNTRSAKEDEDNLQSGEQF